MKKVLFLISFCAVFLLSVIPKVEAQGNLYNTFEFTMDTLFNTTSNYYTVPAVIPDGYKVNWFITSDVLADSCACIVTAQSTATKTGTDRWVTESTPSPVTWNSNVESGTTNYKFISNVDGRRTRIKVTNTRNSTTKVRLRVIAVIRRATL